MLYIQASIDQNGNVKINEEPQNLPINWKNISNLRYLPESELKKEGWYPVVGVQPSFSAEKEVLSGPVLQVTYDKPTNHLSAKHVWTIIARDIEDMRDEYINKIRAQYLLQKRTFFKGFDFDANVIKVGALVAEKENGESWSDLKQLELKELMVLLQRFDSLHKKMKDAIGRIATARNLDEMKKVTDEYAKVKV